MKIALLIVRLASESNLRNLVTEEVADGFIGDITHLIIVIDNLATLVAHTPIAGTHQRIAGSIIGADVAVDAGPTLVAVAGMFGSYGTVLASA